ncbi:MAG TPA: LppX_LprAFG lipoprotein [Acidimicrobiales bacterium]|nr:LppX_LprAFG lipoprotein [Acidimicrobiales bacterium]
MPALRRLLAPAAVLAVAAACASCASSSRPSATALLGEARTTLDKAPAVQFALTSSGVAGKGIDLVGGSGELARPQSLKGTFQVSASGLDVNVKVLAVGARFWAVLPFQTAYSRVSPGRFGLTDPAALLSAHHGLTSLLTDMAGTAHYQPSIRLDGELLDVVSGTVAGSEIPVLPDANPSRPVRLTVAIDPASHQVRRVTLAGPFTQATRSAHYVVTLTGYGRHVRISPPA